MDWPDHQTLSNIFFTLDWLWQDYILYDYYKNKLKERVEAFGRVRIETEKKILRRTLSDALIGCHKPDDIVVDAVKHFCKYYKKDELEIIVELRDAQEGKVMEIPKGREILASRR